MSVLEEEMLTCVLCGGSASKISEPFEGYVEGYVIEILECGSCSARFSSRLDVPDWLYDRIYAQAELIPGYGRYARYEAGVTEHRRPLDLLAEAEDPYWHVREYIAAQSAPQALRVVELGCGAGYLTYALRRAGIQCVGVDISAEAISRARTRSGHAEWFQTVEEFQQDRGAVDLVVALELIEHVPDPVAVVRDALAMLGTDGALLLTTPDRDACRPGEVWASDAPPVHLYWLGRRALQAVADRCGAVVEFPLVRPSSSHRPVPAANHLWPAILTADGDVTESVRRSVRLSARLRLHAAAMLWRLATAASPQRTRRVRRLGAAAPEPAATLAAVLRRPPETRD